MQGSGSGQGAATAGRGSRPGALVDEEARTRRLLFDQLADGLFVLDEAREVVEANLPFCALLGREREEVLRLHPWDWDLRFPSREALLAAFPTLPEATPPVETRLRRSDGGLVPVEAHARQVRWAGRPHLLVICRDVSERHRQEAELRRSREALGAQLAWLEAVLAAQTDGVFVVGTDRVVQRVNRSGVALLGFDATGLDVDQIGARAAMAPSLRNDGPTVRVLRGEPVASRDFELTHPEHGRRQIASQSSPIRDPQGRVLGAVTVLRDITERAREREDLRALAARLQTIREEEKQRIARDLHDDLGQLVTALKMDLRWLERRLSELPPTEASFELQERAVEASRLADRTVATVQRVAAELRPAALGQLGLGAALTAEGRRFAERHGVACEVTVAEGLQALEDAAATGLYRIAQEALTNVARHAGATRAEVWLAPEGAELVLSVADDGRGFEPASHLHSLGLVGMKERATALGGTLAVARRSPRGAQVTVRVPLQRVLASSREAPA